MDRISLIITNYNYEATLRRAVASALASSWKNREVIVVDDGSTDNSVQTIKDYVSSGDVKLVRKDNGGQADARDTGVKNASGEWIAFLDADDEVESDRISLQHEAAQRYGRDCIIMTGSKVIAPNGSWRIRASAKSDSPMLDMTTDFIRGRVRPSEATMFMSRSLYFELGGFCTQIRRQAIIEFFSRVVARDIKIILVNRPLYIQHEHRSSARYRSSYRTNSIKEVFRRIEQGLATCSDPRSHRRVKTFACSRALLLWFASLSWAGSTRNEVLKILMGLRSCSPAHRALFALTRHCPEFLLGTFDRLLVLVGRR